MSSPWAAALFFPGMRPMEVGCFCMLRAARAPWPGCLSLTFHWTSQGPPLLCPWGIPLTGRTSAAGPCSEGRPFSFKQCLTPAWWDCFQSRSGPCRIYSSALSEAGALFPPCLPAFSSAPHPACLCSGVGEHWAPLNLTQALCFLRAPGAVLHTFCQPPSF